MDSLEKHPDFNPELKLQDSDKSQVDSGGTNSDNLSEGSQSNAEVKSHDSAEIQSAGRTDKSVTEGDESTEEDLGFSLFQKAEEEPAAEKGAHTLCSFKQI